MDPQNEQDSVNKRYNLDMASYKIINQGTPTQVKDTSTKEYDHSTISQRSLLPVVL